MTLSGCGGDSGDTVANNGNCFINSGIDMPTTDYTWDTQDHNISLGGLAPTPGGIYSSNCPGDPGYTITWNNTGTGESGNGGAWTSKRFGLFGSYCHTEWRADYIPIALGDNSITVTISDDNGCTGNDSILIRRSVDTTPPTITSTLPAGGDKNVPANSWIYAYFSEQMDGSTVTTDTFMVMDHNNIRLNGTVNYYCCLSGSWAVFKPTDTLSPSEPYTTVITTGAKDRNGNNGLANDYTWNFTTIP
jgi:hypothetical protein